MPDNELDALLLAWNAKREPLYDRDRPSLHVPGGGIRQHVLQDD